MSKDYVQAECKKILGEEPTTKEYALVAAWVIAHFKGINLKIFDMNSTSSLCDYNVIASVENTVQANAMVDELLYTLKGAGLSMLSLEGSSESDWVLLDLGDIIIHLFQEISRDIYDLDTLWSEMEQLEIPQEYYFGQPSEEIKPSSDTENYF